jgi:hypothetical protein
MPNEQFLLLQMHELLRYLGHHGVMTLLVLGQHGLVGEVSSDVDLSYLSDTIIHALLRVGRRSPPRTLVGADPHFVRRPGKSIIPVPALPTEGSMPATLKRSVYLFDRWRDRPAKFART